MRISHFRSKYRLASLSLLIGLSALGGLSRIFPMGSILWDKYLGDVVYAGVFYFALCVILGQSNIPLKSSVSAGYVTLIEFFQLTPIPLRLNQSSNILIKLFAYIVLGSTFSWWDLLAYAVGIAFAVLMDGFILGKLEQRITPHPPR